MHFFSPANVMRLLEVVRGEKTAKDVLATVMQLGKTIRKTAVVSGVCDGFIGNRMLEQYSRQALFLLEEGASPQQVDGASRSSAWPWARSAWATWRATTSAGRSASAATPSTRTCATSRIADRLCELGRFGQKTGAGWYRYEAGQARRDPDPGWTRSSRRTARQLAITPRKIGDEEIVERCVFALVNEGARILEEGIAQRASDIDVVYLTGYGFPLYRGGPMFYADTRRACTTWCGACARSRPSPHADAGSGSRRRCSRSSPPKARPSTTARRAPLGASRHHRRSHD